MYRTETDYISAWLCRDARERGFTQMEIANAVNVSRQTIYHFWTRKQDVTLPYIISYAKLVDIPLPKFLHMIADAIAPENRGSLDQFMDDEDKRIAEKKRPPRTKKDL